MWYKFFFSNCQIWFKNPQLPSLILKVQNQAFSDELRLLERNPAVIKSLGIEKKKAALGLEFQL